MKHHNGCKHLDKISGNCKLNTTWTYMVLFGGKKCDYHPLYKFKCYEQEERPEFVPPKGATFIEDSSQYFYNGVGIVRAKGIELSEVKSVDELFKKYRARFKKVIRSLFDSESREFIRSLFDSESREYYIIALVQQGGDVYAWELLDKITTPYKDKHMVDFINLSIKIGERYED